MKVLLRNTKTNHYYVDNNQWTADSRYARDFQQVEQAIELQRNEQLRHLEVVLSFDDPLCDLVLPIGTPG
jgi:hypothetical protein